MAGTQPCSTAALGWSAKPMTCPRSELKYQSQHAITIYEIFEPVHKIAVEPGKVVYDLGQKLSIMVRVVLQDLRKAKVIVRYSETLGGN